MEIKLTKEEAEEIFYVALCNAVGTGYMEGYGISLKCNPILYQEAREVLIGEEAETCYENILMQVLRDGGALTFVDHEGDGDMTRTITIADIHSRVEKAPIQNLVNIINENDDVGDADVVLQTVFFEDVIFG